MNTKMSFNICVINNQFVTKRCNKIQIYRYGIESYISSVINNKDNIALMRNGKSNPLHCGEHLVECCIASNIRVKPNIFKHVVSILP
jgi:hypothetical protein